jgi:quercetin dioxygenase-like cupin family protein
MAKPILVSPGGGKSVNVLGALYRIKVHGSESGGAFSVVETSDAPGSGTPPHTHTREDETIYVLDGEYEFFCRGERHLAKAGTTVFAPRNIQHCYKNAGKTSGKLLVIITPAGFEKFFEELDAMPAAEQQIPRVVELGRKYGLEFPPPP